jgi:hypothetical protein
MRDDLQHARASIGWAEANFPVFQKQLNVWLDQNVHLAVREQPSNVPNDVVVLAEKGPLPATFQVEAGIYINAIRSSLDILASTLANRYCQLLADDAYFPIAPSKAIFLSGKGYKGDKFIRALPAKEREIIEALNPYRGQDGNNILCAIHDLDIVRKHQRLLAAEVSPRTFIVSGWGKTTEAFTPVSSGWVRTGADEMVLSGMRLEFGMACSRVT